MAIGIKPKYRQAISLGDLSPGEFAVLAFDAARAMNYRVVYLGVDGILAYANKETHGWNAELLLKLEQDSAVITSTSITNAFVDWGKNRQLAAGFIAAIEQVKNQLNREEIALKFQQANEWGMLRYDGFLSRQPQVSNGIFGDFISLVRPVGTYFITPLLLDINVLLFMLMAFSGVNIMLPDNVSLLTWGANFRPLTMEGEWWRLLTNCFLHIGVIHLLMNMYALFFIGLLLEPYLGKVRFLMAYLITGIAASVVSLWWHDMNVISAGASGAIFGMYGVFLAMLTTNLIEKKQRKTLLVSIVFFVGYNLLSGVKGGIDNAAHIGGLLSGMVTGYLFIPSLKKGSSGVLKYATILVAALVVAVSSVVMVKHTSQDMVVYDREMKMFEKNEQVAMAIYTLREGTPKEKLLAEITDRGIPQWQRNLKLLENLGHLQLPDVVRKRNEFLKRYCSLRLQSYDVMYKYINLATPEARTELDEYNKRIQMVLDSLNPKVKEVE